MVIVEQFGSLEVLSLEDEVLERWNMLCIKISRGGCEYE